MKKKYFILGILWSIIATSCTDYLDVSPDSGLTEEELFTNFSNSQKFFNAVYNGDKTELDPKAYNLDVMSTFPIEFENGPRSFGLNQTVDLYCVSKSGGSTSFIKGTWGPSAWFDSSYGNSTSNNFRPIYKGLFNIIRVCNTTLQNIDKIEDANKQSDIEDLRGQAYFLRAYAHFTLGSIWGPFPYIEDIMTIANYDRKRLSTEEYFKAVADDCDKARVAFEAAGLMRRDPQPGTAGHLADPNQNKPTGVSALALKSRALLYRASPLNNKANDTQLWVEAAEAAMDALTVAKANGYDLMPWVRYYENFRGTEYSNEQLWAWSRKSLGHRLNAWSVRTILGTTMTGQTESTGEHPTQNLVDMYDTKWGEPLVTEQDRATAALSGHYDEADPYANRDPRFDGNIFYNQRAITWDKVNLGEEKNKFNIFFTMVAGKPVYSTFGKGYTGLIGDTQTGYVCRKRTGDFHFGKQTPVENMTEPLFRLVELYLNYAEAANEAYSGPDGKSPSGTMTALEALNVVRERVSPDLKLDRNNPTVATYAGLQERIQKERTIEFDQEGNHRYFDIRRWKIAPKVFSKPLYGMNIERISSTTTLPYKQRFRHTRYQLPEVYQPIWNDKMYYWPFERNDYYKYDIFDVSLNPWW